jgi:hypothetical protein
VCVCVCLSIHHSLLQVLSATVFFSFRRQRNAEQRSCSESQFSRLLRSFLGKSAHDLMPELTGESSDRELKSHEQTDEIIKRRVRILHLLVRRLGDSNLPPPSRSQLQQLIEQAGLQFDHPDSMFAMNELKTSVAVHFLEHSITLAAQPIISRGNCAVEVGAVTAAQVWQSKDEVQLYFKRTIVAMSDVTGVDEISVSFALQSNLGCLVGAMKDIVTFDGSTRIQASVQPLIECQLMTVDCCGSMLCCPSCGFVACSACHLHNVQGACSRRFPMLDDLQTRDNFSQVGVQQSFAFFCCPEPACGRLLPREFWQTLKESVTNSAETVSDEVLFNCARLVSRVSRHHAHPRIISCPCSRFFWQPSPLCPVRV